MARRMLFRRVERTLIGGVMGLVAWIIEWRVVRVSDVVRPRLRLIARGTERAGGGAGGD